MNTVLGGTFSGERTHFASKIKVTLFFNRKMDAEYFFIRHFFQKKKKKKKKQ